jgi:PAS domain S-box-containing protein
MSFIDRLKVQSKGLVLLLAATLLLAIAIPLINFYIVYPRYGQEIINETEANAIRLTRHMSHLIIGNRSKLTAENLLQFDDPKIATLIHDFNLVKMKIFDSSGTVLLSTDPKQIGTVNNNDYFHRIVAKGSPFSKVVRKDHKSMEGTTVKRDIIETYVPIMTDDTFIGAFELYFDITPLRDKLQKAFTISMLLPAPIIGLFLAAIFLTVFKLDRRNSAEIRLKQTLLKQKETLAAEHQKQLALFRRVENAKQQWETTMDCLSELVILTAPDFSIIRCNNAVEELTGLSFRELIGQKFTDILQDTHLAGGDTTIGESHEYFHPPSGKTFFLSLFPVAETITQQPGFVISMADITSMKKMTFELQKATDQAKKSRNTLQYALDNIATLISDALDGNAFKVDFPMADENKCWKVMECDRKDCPCYGKKDVRCWREAGTFCNKREQGLFEEKIGSCLECKYFLGVTKDPATLIGEQFSNLMFMLNNKNKELESAYLELKQTQSQLLQQEKMASVGQLAAGVAHEINNPVGFVSSNLGTLGKYVERLHGFITFLEEHLKTVANADIQALLDEQRTKVKLDFIMEDIKDLITESLDGCERVKKIVSNLKGFSRIDQAERQYININDCIDTTLNVATNELKYKTKIEKEYGEISDIECLPQQLNQVFLNLLINAAHAIEKEGVISIKTWQDEQSVYASFSDTGSGIKPENLPHIFEPFFTTKEIGKGTGLGLSIVYDIITKNHKGDIDVTSEVGMGTTFTIQLPRIQPKDSQPEQNT